MLSKTTINNRGRVTEHYVVTDRRFTLDGHKCEIVATRITGEGNMDSKHKIKGHPEHKVLQHGELVNFWKTGKIT